MAESWSICPGGASIIVTLGNPMLAEYPGCTYEMGYVPNRKRKNKNPIEIFNNMSKLIKEKVDVSYLEKIVSAYNLNKVKASNNNVMLEDYHYDDKKYPPGKNSIEQLFKCKDLKSLMMSINEEFTVSTGIPKQS